MHPKCLNCKETQSGDLGKFREEGGGSIYPQSVARLQKIPNFCSGFKSQSAIYVEDFNTTFGVYDFVPWTVSNKSNSCGDGSGNKNNTNAY